jgi:hypothetical protein
MFHNYVVFSTRSLLPLRDPVWRPRCFVGTAVCGNCWVVILTAWFWYSWKLVVWFWLVLVQLETSAYYVQCYSIPLYSGVFEKPASCVVPMDSVLQDQTLWFLRLKQWTVFVVIVIALISRFVELTIVLNLNVHTDVIVSIILVLPLVIKSHFS